MEREENIYKKKPCETRGLAECYRFYKDKVGRNGIGYRTYAKVCREFNIRMANKIITESFEFRLPYRLGFLRIKAIDQKIVIKDGRLDMTKNPIDWEATWAYWRELYPGINIKNAKDYPDKPLIPHINEQTNGKLIKWHWDRRLSNVSNITAYVFKAVKGGVSSEGYYYGRRGLPNWVKSDERFNDYFE